MPRQREKSCRRAHLMMTSCTASHVVQPFMYHVPSSFIHVRSFMSFSCTVIRQSLFMFSHRSFICSCTFRRQACDVAKCKTAAKPTMRMRWPSAAGHAPAACRADERRPRFQLIYYDDARRPSSPPMMPPAPQPGTCRRGDILPRDYRARKRHYDLVIFAHDGPYCCRYDKRAMMAALTCRYLLSPKGFRRRQHARAQALFAAKMTQRRDDAKISAEKLAAI